MIALDVSVLAYAVNRYAPEHARASKAVEEIANADAPWALPWPVVYSFIRFVTHPHAVARPLGPGDAQAFVERLIESPGVRCLAPGPAHARTLKEVLATLDPAAAHHPGLETAVVLREHGIRELLSSDRGMRRFHFLTVVDPVHGEGWSAQEPPLRRYRVLHPRPRR